MGMEQPPASVAPMADGSAIGGDAALPVILVVEDSSAIAAVLSEALEEEGYSVHVAHNGRLAIERARTLNPTLITLDVGLPDVTGADLVRALRAERTTRNTPIVAVSASVGELDPLVRSEVSGAVGKPFYAWQVVEAVNAVLRPSHRAMEPGR